MTGTPRPPGRPARLTCAPHEPESLAARLDAFAGAYRFLSRALLAPPDAALTARLAAPGLLDDWPLTGDDASERGRALLRESVGAGAGEPEDIAALARDYADLFVGPGPLLAPPYESVHRTTDRLIFDAPTMQVRAAYLAFDLVAPRLYHEPDDHLGLELHFLGEVCTRALDALDQGEEFALDTALAAHQTFLSDHLLLWGPACLQLIQTHATTSFYRGIAALGLGTLHQAQETFLE